MADQEVCSRIEQRPDQLWARSGQELWVAEGCKPVEIHRRMSDVYYALYFSRKNVYKALVSYFVEPAPCGGDLFTSHPLRFFANISKAAASSAAVFDIAVYTSLSHRL